MKMDVAIIDYKMSNLHSVQAACAKSGLYSVITSDINEIMDAKSAILPGVGAFEPAMIQLSKLKLDKCISDFIATGKMFVGICLGMQLLFEESEEFGKCKGLGIIKGEVKKFTYKKIGKIKYPIPCVGWNQIVKKNHFWDTSLLKNNSDREYMYFVHSFYVKPVNKNVVLTTSKYGDLEYCSSIIYKNIFATQFHPEKSGSSGLKIYSSLKESLKLT